MRRQHLSTMAAALLLGFAAAATAPARAQQPTSGTEASQLAELKAEVEALTRNLPSQSHTMADVEYHFTNLWFAGRNGDWDLAGFYLNETRSHLEWTVRLHPVRRVSTGEFDLRPMLETVEKAGLAPIKAAIGARDGAAFEKAYRQMLNECYACHTAAEKPYLRPEIPQTPASHLMIHASH